MLSGCSGVGKDTVVKEIVRIAPEFVISVSATTRKIRSNEKNGIDYHFLSAQDFDSAVSSNKFLEYASYCGNRYGTLKNEVEKYTKKGRNVILVIEVQGGKKVKKSRPDSVSVFILPPSLHELENRLRSRGLDDEESIIRRLKRAEFEIEESKNYDLRIINKNYAICAQDILEFIREIAP